MMSQSQQEEAFGMDRIKALQDERLNVQKKTFTKWVNQFLVQADMEVEDLFTDLADGRILLKLLEIISGYDLGKLSNGKVRVQKIDNVERSLAFLRSKKVRLENIWAEDIVDGNPKLILGLIWTIILRFHNQEIATDEAEENKPTEENSAAEAEANAAFQGMSTGENIQDIQSEDTQEVPSEGIQDVLSEYIEDVPNEDIQDIQSEDIQEVPSEDIQDVPSKNIQEVLNEDIQDVLNEDIEEVPSEEIQEVPNEDIQDVENLNITYNVAEGAPKHSKENQEIEVITEDEDDW